MKEFKKIGFDLDNSMINKSYNIDSEIMKYIITDKKEIMRNSKKRLSLRVKYKKKVKN